MAVTALFGFLGVLAGIAARLLVGRLRRGVKLPPPWCELLTGVLWAASGGWWAAGRLPTSWLPLLLALGWLAVAAGGVDLACRRLPDALTLPAVPAVLMLTIPLGAASVGRAALGAGALFGAHLVVRRAAPAGLGAGDVKLAAALGGVLGAVSWPAIAAGTALAAAITGLAALAGVLTGRLHLADGVPHGPAMLAAAWLVVATAGLGAAASAGWPS
ncbi:MAG: prepilin peptidase [Pseudonocardia sp.]|nr:prepilin peptidase [Pseudonocardia sp.]